jgi:hypothetical protein
LLGTLKALNPGAVISGAAMGSGMSLPDLEHETAVLLPELPGDAAGPIKATAIDIDETIDWLPSASGSARCYMREATTSCA